MHRIRPTHVLVLLLLAAVNLPATPAMAVGIACPPPATTAPDASPVPAAAPDASPDTPFPDSGELTVFAAASLTESFTEMGDAVMAANPGITITFNFAGSQALATQLEQGAPADLFAPADATQMQVAIDAGVIDGEPLAFTLNRLAIVVPADNPAGIESPADLAQDDLRLVLAQPEVPVGRYSAQAICAMGQTTTTYGEGFVERVGENIVSQEEDVRAVLTKVQLGEADAGIVYASDITADAAENVAIIEIPEAVNVIATYPIAPIAGGNTKLAEAFIAYVLGPEGQSTLESHGFTPLS